MMKLSGKRNKNNKAKSESKQTGADREWGGPSWNYCAWIEAVNLSFIFTRDDGEIEDRAKVSTSPLFEGLLIYNFESPKSYKNKMHDNIDMT